MNYKVRIQESEEGYSVSCPGLPGCWSQGKTEEEALENIRDAIQEYLAAINARPVTVATAVRVDSPEVRRRLGFLNANGRS